MPVVLPSDREHDWMEAGPEERRDLCRPYPDDDLDAYPISTRVNAPSNDSPPMIEPTDSEQAGLENF